MSTACATAPQATLKHGDTGEKSRLLADITDKSGAAVDLTGFTQVLLTLRARFTGGPTTSVFGGVEGDPVLGRVFWEPVAADWLVIVPGSYDTEWQITFVGPSILTAPSDGYNTLDIAEALA